jgi:hypothetical protein
MVSGQCLCGKVRFEVSGDLGNVRLCYCELCRRANGTAFSANVRVPADSYELLSGHEVIREYESSPGAAEGRPAVPSAWRRQLPLT